MDDPIGDPLAVLWTATAKFFGCATDKAPRDLLLGICDHLVAGEVGDGMSLAVRAEAAERLAAAYADIHGLRLFWCLPDTGRAPFSADPLRESDGVAAEHASYGRFRLRGTPCEAALGKAMATTARLAALLRKNGVADAAWNRACPPHPLGFGPGSPSLDCGTCGWFLPGTPPSKGHCLHARLVGRRKLVGATTPACNRFEPPLREEDCGACGACCHRGFSLVPVLAGDRVAMLRPDWVKRDSWGRHIPRPQGLCLALQGNGSEGALWRCRIYDDRPRHCRDFAVRSLACLEARRRAGIGP